MTMSFSLIADKRRREMNHEMITKIENITEKLNDLRGHL